MTASIHPLDLWVRRLTPVTLMGRRCLAARNENLQFQKTLDDLTEAEILAYRCVLHLDDERVARELVPWSSCAEVLEADDPEDFDQEYREAAERFRAAWLTPLPELLAGAEHRRVPPKRLWGFDYGIGAGGMMGGSSAFFAEAFDEEWAVVQDGGWHELFGHPFGLPMGLVPRDRVKALAPLLYREVRGCYWDESFQFDRVIPFDWLRGDAVEIYRFCVAVSTDGASVYRMSDEEFLAAYPTHPKSEWGFEDLRRITYPPAEEEDSAPR